MTEQSAVEKIKTAIEQGYEAGHYSGYQTDPTPTTVLTQKETYVKKYSKYGEPAQIDSKITDQFKVSTADYNKALELIKQQKQQTAIEKIENAPASMPVQNYQVQYDIPRGTMGTEATSKQVSNITPSPVPPLIFIVVILIGGLWLISR